MNITPDIITIVGWVVGGLGIVLLLFEIKGDRARGRLRCKRCWYDLRDTPRVDGGWSCPECGKRLVRERQLRRTRRRWKLVAISLVLLTTPGGLYAGRVTQEKGWPSLLPDWVLVRMPIDLDWVLENPDSAEVDLAWYAAPSDSIEGTIRRRVDTMSDGSRNTYLRRLLRAINSERREDEAGRFLLAYDMIDLVQPPQEFIDQYPRYYGSGCSGPPARVSARDRLGSARDEFAHGTKVLVDLITNSDMREPYSYCADLDGLLLARADRQGHAQIARTLDLIRKQPAPYELAPGRLLVWHDLSDLARAPDSWDSPFEEQREDIRLILTELVNVESWFCNGGNDAGLAPIGHVLAVVAPSEMQENIRAVLQLMRNPASGVHVNSRRDGVATTVTAYDIRDYIARQSMYPDWQGWGNSCWSVLPDEEVAENVRLHLTETVEPDAWIDNGGDEASLRYWNGIFLVRTTLDLDDRIRAELARIERGEVELEY